MQTTKISNRVKLIYIANARIPTEKAHGIQIMKMCEAFSELKTEGERLKVELIIPNRSNNIKQSAFEYYGVKKTFKITKLPVLDLFFLNLKVGFLVESITFTVSLFFYLLFRGRKPVFYVRGETILPLALFCKKPIFWETHIKPEKIGRYCNIFRRITGFVVVTKYYKKQLTDEFNIPPDKILYFPDSVDLNEFNIKISKSEARKKLGLPMDKKIVFYAGSFLSWKGVDTLLDAIKYLEFSASNFKEILFVFAAAGEKNDIEEFKKKSLNLNLNNVLIVEQRPHKEIAFYLKASDILVLTGTSKSKISKYYTSPMKLFEYMASKRPVIAPRLPSFLDILNDENSLLVKPDSGRLLSDGIKMLLDNKALADSISEKAWSDVQEYTWNKRARRIIIFIGNKI